MAFSSCFLKKFPVFIKEFQEFLCKNSRYVVKSSMLSDLCLYKVLSNNNIFDILTEPIFNVRGVVAQLIADPVAHLEGFVVAQFVGVSVVQLAINC